MSDTAIRIDRADNVISLLRAHAAGEVPVFDGRQGPALVSDVPFGHKIAIADIPKGNAVVKYGAPIGRATADIAAGEHVHLHNLRGEIA